MAKVGSTGLLKELYGKTAALIGCSSPAVFIGWLRVLKPGQKPRRTKLGGSQSNPEGYMRGERLAGLHCSLISHCHSWLVCASPKQHRTWNDDFRFVMIFPFDVRYTFFPEVLLHDFMCLGSRTGRGGKQRSNSVLEVDGLAGEKLTDRASPWPSISTMIEQPVWIWTRFRISCLKGPYEDDASFLGS